MRFLLIFLFSVSALAGDLQNSDFATPAQITGAGGTLSQLLNTTNIWDTTNNQQLSTTIAGFGGGAVSSVNGLTGVVVLDTDDISEGVSNLYFTNSRAISAPITGYVSGAGVVSATDSILQAIQKLNGNIAAIPGASTEIQEIPVGLINSINDTYLLSQVPTGNASVKLYLDGLFQRQGTDYTISGSTITMITAPATGQTLDANYDY